MANKKINQLQSKNVIIETRTRRFFALLIDWYLTQTISVIPITFYLRNGDYLKPYMFDFSSYSFPVGLGLIIYGIIIGLIYYWLIPSYLFNGQTIGKKICKIKIVTTNYQPVTGKIMFIREIFTSTLIEGGILITATQLHRIPGLLGFNNITTYWQYLAYIITIISIAYAYFNSKTQSFHDIVAKTLVIKSK